jgi:hypothetical protein
MRSQAAVAIPEGRLDLFLDKVDNSADPVLRFELALSKGEVVSLGWAEPRMLCMRLLPGTEENGNGPSCLVRLEDSSCNAVLYMIRLARVRLEMRRGHATRTICLPARSFWTAFQSVVLPSCGQAA